MNDSRYEELYSQLFDTAKEMHEHNKKRLRGGVTAYFVLPVVLAVIRYITDSDKTFFLIIWVFLMFIISAYLIVIEYIDYQIISKLNDVADQEAEFDELVPRIAENDRIADRIRRRIAERREASAALSDSRTETADASEAAASGYPAAAPSDSSTETADASETAVSRYPAAVPSDSRTETADIPEAEVAEAEAASIVTEEQNGGES